MTALIKIGGRAAERDGTLVDLFKEMKGLREELSLILVHGGGADVTAVSRRLGVESVFDNGVRRTSPEEMDIVDMVLCGKVNKRLVRLCRTSGLNAVGICGCDGGSFLGAPVSGGATESRTAEMGRIDTAFIALLLERGYLPVISPASMDERGRAMNINADSVAFALAAALATQSLVFLSDIPGILKQGEVIRELSGPDAKGLVEKGIIKGGMIPKVGASLEALKKGVNNVIIGEYGVRGDLTALLEGKRGTRIRE
jgi:acetylglutamate kinase